MRTRQTEIDAARELGPAMGTLAQMSRNDPAVFNQFVLRDEETGFPIRLAPMHEEWHDVLTQHERAVLWAHTESGKTANISIGRALYEIGRNPNIRILVISASAGQAKKIVKAVKNYIERSLEFRMVFPNVIPDKSDTSGMWREDAFIVKRTTMSKDPTMQAVGYNGNVLGGRYDLIIIDDYLTDENTYSDRQREKYFRWLKSTIEGRKTGRSKLWFIGNAWHIDDAMHRYAAEEATYAKKYPVRTAEGVSSWPAVWPDARIEKEIQNRGPIESQRSLFCDPVSDAERKFKLDYVLKALAKGDGLELAWALTVVPPGYRTITGVDLAVTKRDSSDETALVTIAVDDRPQPIGTQERQVLDVDAGKWSGPEIVQKIFEVQHRYNSIVIVESNACFPAGTPVLTLERGYVPIEDVRIGEHTWTHRARWRRVVDTISGTGRRVSPTRASGSLPIVPTSNHWFYMRRAGRTPGRAGGHHRPVGDPDWISAGFAQHAAYTAIAVPRWPATQPILRLPRTKRSAAREVEVDETIAMFLGLYMAEGCGGGLRGEAQVKLALGHQEGYIAEWAAVVLRELAPSRAVRVWLKDSTMQVCASTTALARALAVIGKGAAKTLPIEWLGWPLPLRLAVVRGWLIGDGALVWNNKRNKSRSRKFTGTSISRNWIAWARATLLEAGFRPTIDRREPHSSKLGDREIVGGVSYGISLSADDSRRLYASMSTPIERRRWGALEADGRVRIDASRSHHAGGHLWSYVLHGPGRFEAFDGPVHNLVVEEDESFTANDYIVHNAQLYIKQFVEDRTAVPVKAFYTGRNKVDPAFGIQSLAIEMSAGKWVIPNAGGAARGIHAHMNDQVRKMLGEMLRYDPQSHTGDRLVACWLAREGARMTANPAGVGKRPRRT